MIKTNFFLLLVVLMLLGITACSQSEAFSVLDIWARPGLAEGNSAVFFVIDNSTGKKDRLLSAASDVAKAVELHKTIMEDGVMKMNRQDFVSIPEGEQVVFKPGDLHVMLIGLNKDLMAGDSFSVVLTFEHMGDVQLEVTVREP
jgi:copper(I)-binding protein